MRTSEEGIKLIKGFESFAPKAYLCPAKRWTLGWGTTRGVQEGDTVTLEEAEQMLEEDLRSTELFVEKAVKVQLRQNELDALVSLVYNIGIGNFRTSTLLKQLNQGNIDLAAMEFERWNKGGGMTLPGLTRRRRAEKELFLLLN